LAELSYNHDGSRKYRILRKFLESLLSFFLIEETLVVATDSRSKKPLAKISMSQLIEQTVILGGGFTGLYTALHLSQNNYPHSVILIDRQDRFCFRPLLYEYASSQMDNEQVRPRFADLLAGSGVKFVQDSVESIDFQNQTVQLTSQTCPYSHLVIGLGSVTGYFGIKGAKENALPFREAQDAIAVDHQVRHCLQQALQTDDFSQRQAWLTFVIVGAGPTGVELAGTLADLVPHWYAKQGGNPQEVRVILLSRGAEILKGDINDPLREKAKVGLQKRAVAVELTTNATVTAVHPEKVEYEQNDETKQIPAYSTFWTAGTATHPIIKDLPLSDESKDKKGRLIVEPTLQLSEFPNVFVGGDCAVMRDHSYPPTAQVAHQQGSQIAQNLQALVAGKAPQQADVGITGTFMKMGLEDGIANIFNRLEVDGTTGHLMRQGTYMNILPTPKHNLKISGKWINEEIYQEYLKPESTGQALKWVAGAVIGAVVARKVAQALTDNDN
jgi:NADH dehydrogenase FAD-containing subunit